MNNPTVVGETIAKTLKQALDDTENRVDAELEKLDALDEDALEALRERRRREFQQTRADLAAWRQLGHGELVESAGEVAFFDFCRKSPKVFCHFYHPTVNVERSQYLTKHLRQLAANHLDILFLNADAERHPFLTGRLNIYVIPSIIVIKEMKMAHVSQGFSELNNSDDWKMSDLEEMLKKHEMLKPYRPDWYKTREEIVYEVGVQ